MQILDFDGNGSEVGREGKREGGRGGREREEFIENVIEFS